MKRRRLQPRRANVGGIAEVVLKDIDPELLERIRERIAEDKVSESQQVQAKLQERPKQNHKKRAKERDRGLEL